jgi:cytidylate kinase
VEARDRRDETRAASPLRPAEDALTIDNSDLDEAATLARVLQAVHRKY